MPQNKISFGEIGSCFQIKRTVVVWKHHSFLLSFFFWWGNHGWSLWVSITPVPVITCHWWWILSCNWFHPQSKVGASETRHPKAFGDCRRRAPPAPVEIDRRQPLSILRFARFVCAGAVMQVMCSDGLRKPSCLQWNRVSNPRLLRSCPAQSRRYCCDIWRQMLQIICLIMLSKTETGSTRPLRVRTSGSWCLVRCDFAKLLSCALQGTRVEEVVLAC